MSTARPSPPAARPSLVVTVLLVLLHVVAWSGLLLFLGFSVPRFERTFADFRMRLPDATIAVIEASRWVVKYFYVAAISLGMFAVVDGVILHLLRGGRGRALAWLWFALMLLLPLALLVASWLVIWEPYARLLEGLQRPA